MPSNSPQSKTRTYVKDRKLELELLAEVLAGTGVVRSVDPLTTAIVKKGQDPLEWHLHMVDELLFDLDRKAVKAQRNSKPSDLKSISLSLKVGLWGRCLDKDALKDPFFELAVECVVTARRKDTTGDYHSAWHLDRDKPPEAGKKRADLAHPAYHLQYGGQRLPPLGSPGNHLLLGSPRVPHPPLDGVLAVDFVLSNYFPKLWRDLRFDARYKGLIAESQWRCWRPYSMASAERWIDCAPAWDGQPIWPQVVQRGDLPSIPKMS